MNTENDRPIAALGVLRIVLLVVLSPVWVPVVVFALIVELVVAGPESAVGFARYMWDAIKG